MTHEGDIDQEDIKRWARSYVTRSALDQAISLTFSPVYRPSVNTYSTFVSEGGYTIDLLVTGRWPIPLYEPQFTDTIELETPLRSRPIVHLLWTEIGFSLD